MNLREAQEYILSVVDASHPGDPVKLAQACAVVLRDTGVMWAQPQTIQATWMRVALPPTAPSNVPMSKPPITELGES